MYSEKAKNFCEISSLLLSYVVPVKSKVDISQNYAAFWECMNFTYVVVQGMQLLSKTKILKSSVPCSAIFTPTKWFLSQGKKRNVLQYFLQGELFTAASFAYLNG